MNIGNMVATKAIWLIYVCGPYRANTVFGIYQNIQRAKERSIEIVRKGYYPVVPHLCTGFLDGLADDDSFFLPSGIELMRRCDAVYLVSGWQNSSGSLAEIKEALSLQIPVYDENNVEMTEADFRHRTVRNEIRAV